MRPEEFFLTQLPSGQIPTLMINKQEGRRHWVDTLAITTVTVYLAQMVCSWQTLWGNHIQRALDFIKSRAYQHEIEGFWVFHFNAFYPPDWEDTSFAIYLLARNQRLEVGQLGRLRDLLQVNTTDDGTGVWVKDSYSSTNVLQNRWDPTCAMNILRLHYLLETDRSCRKRTERFIERHLYLDQFGRATLYYTAPLAAFFAVRLVADFPDITASLRNSLTAFHQEAKLAIERDALAASPFEKALLGFPSAEHDPGLIFHHERREVIWYGSPILHHLARLPSIRTFRHF